MARQSHVLGRIIISLIFIALGIGSVVTMFSEILALNLSGIFSCAIGVITFITGVLGLFKLSVKTCRLLAIVVFLAAAVNFVLAILAGAFLVVPTWIQLAIAILAWYFIAWIRKN